MYLFAWRISLQRTDRTVLQMQKKTSLLGNLPLRHEKGEAGVGEKKHQERFPVVIRLLFLMAQSLTYFVKLKSLLPSNVRQIQINLPNKIFALKITQSSIHLIVLAFGAINLH